MTDLELTLAGLAACSILGLFSFMKHFKKRDTLKPAPLIPWIWPFLAALATGFMLLVHLIKYHVANAIF